MRRTINIDTIASNSQKSKTVASVAGGAMLTFFYFSASAILAERQIDMLVWNSSHHTHACKSNHTSLNRVCCFLHKNKLLLLNMLVVLTEILIAKAIVSSTTALRTSGLSVFFLSNNGIFQTVCCSNRVVCWSAFLLSKSNTCRLLRTGWKLRSTVFFFQTTASHSSSSNKACN